MITPPARVARRNDGALIADCRLRGERPKAFVELAQGEDATEEELMDFAKEHLTGYMRPSAVEITKLPKTSTGKIQKKELRDKEWEGHERRIG